MCRSGDLQEGAKVSEEREEQVSEESFEHSSSKRLQDPTDLVAQGERIHRLSCDQNKVSEPFFDLVDEMLETDRVKLTLIVPPSFLIV